VKNAPEGIDMVNINVAALIRSMLRSSRKSLLACLINVEEKDEVRSDLWVGGPWQTWKR